MVSGQEDTLAVSLWNFLSHSCSGGFQWVLQNVIKTQVPTVAFPSVPSLLPLHAGYTKAALWLVLLRLDPGSALTKVHFLFDILIMLLRQKVGLREKIRDYHWVLVGNAKLG